MNHYESFLAKFVESKFDEESGEFKEIGTD